MQPRGIPGGEGGSARLSGSFCGSFCVDSGAGFLLRRRRREWFAFGDQTFAWAGRWQQNRQSRCELRARDAGAEWPCGTTRSPHDAGCEWERKVISASRLSHKSSCSRPPGFLRPGESATTPSAGLFFDLVFMWSTLSQLYC
jgi:hypothetical protein